MIESPPKEQEGIRLSDGADVCQNLDNGGTQCVRCGVGLPPGRSNWTSLGRLCDEEWETFVKAHGGTPPRCGCRTLSPICQLTREEAGREKVKMKRAGQLFDCPICRHRIIEHRGAK